jgi:hypothetical protein
MRHCYFLRHPSALACLLVASVLVFAATTPCPAQAQAAAENEDEPPILKATPDTKAITLKRAKNAIGSLLLVQSEAGSLGQFTKITAVAQPTTLSSPGELAYDRFLGPLTMKGLDAVMKAVQTLHGGWPGGQRITLSFSQRVAPAELLPANLASALLIDSLIRDWEIDQGYAVLGVVQPDGTIGPVSAIASRMDGVGGSRITRLAVPEGDQLQVADYLLSAGITSFLGTHVFTVKHYNDAGRLALLKLDPQMNEAVTLFGSVQRMLSSVGPGRAVELLLEPRVQGTLQKVLNGAPSLLSAQILLDWGTGKKTQISLGGSLDAIDRFAPTVLRGFRAKTNEAVALPKEKVTLENARLRVLKDRVDAQVRPYVESILRFGDALQKAQSGGAGGKAAQATLETARTQANEEWMKVVRLRSGLTP